MSRWVDQFKSHPFRDSWNTLKKLTDTIQITDETVKTDLEELARLRKVVTFVDELLKAVDPELSPQNVWDSSRNQSDACLNELNAYKQNRNIVHMQNANSNLDNILTYVRPYIVSGKSAAQAANYAFKTYAKTVTETIDLLKNQTQPAIDNINKNYSEANAILNEIKEIQKPIKDFERSLFESTPEEKGLKDQIVELFEESKVCYATIFGYFQKLTKGNEQEAAIIMQIDLAKTKSLKDEKEINNSLKSTQKEIDKLKYFYKTVFGEEKEDGEFDGGLKKELETRLSDLESFKIQQQQTYKTLINEINTLLPGATSAGLSNAYMNLKKDSKKQVTWHTNIFYCSLAFLTIMAFLSVTHKFGWFYIEFIDIENPIAWLQKIIYKLPFVVPALWLALFASKRRSEFQRLEQEYAHKEALAKSYHSFREQIDKLNENDDALMKRLLESAINAISFNASETLDRKHGDKLPTQEIVQKIIDGLSPLTSLPP